MKELTAIKQARAKIARKYAELVKGCEDDLESLPTVFGKLKKALEERNFCFQYGSPLPATDPMWKVLAFDIAFSYVYTDESGKNLKGKDFLLGVAGRQETIVDGIVDVLLHAGRVAKDIHAAVYAPLMEHLTLLRSLYDRHERMFVFEGEEEALKYAEKLNSLLKQLYYEWLVEGLKSR